MSDAGNAAKAATKGLSQNGSGLGFAIHILADDQEPQRRCERPTQPRPHARDEPVCAIGVGRIAHGADKQHRARMAMLHLVRARDTLGQVGYDLDTPRRSRKRLPVKSESPWVMRSMIRPHAKRLLRPNPMRRMTFI